MTTKQDMERLFPTKRQEGGDHYSKHKIQPYTFIQTNGLSFFLRKCYQVRSTL